MIIYKSDYDKTKIQKNMAHFKTAARWVVELTKFPLWETERGNAK